MNPLQNVWAWFSCYSCQVSLVGTVGGGYKSDLAVDDVSFVAGSCHGESDIGGVAGADVQNGKERKILVCWDTAEIRIWRHFR